MVDTPHDMTDEEYDALDELWTRTTPKLATGKQRGFFTEHREQLILLDEKTVRYINAKADATNQTPAELVAGFIRRDLAASE